MNTHKLLKKNIRHRDSRQTLASEHNARLKKFQDYYDTLPEKKEELNVLNAELLSIKSSVQKRNIGTEINTIENKISLLRNVILEIKDRTDETNYLLKAMPFLKCKKSDEDTDSSPLSPNSHMENFLDKTGVDHRGNLYRSYMETCCGVITVNNSDKYRAPDHTLCPQCGYTDRQIEIRSAELVCPECGLAESYQDDSTPAQYCSHINVLSPYAYKRMNHFKEYLTQLQAKETTVIPQDIIILLKKELQKERITDLNCVTPDKIRTYLKKLNLNKYYEHTTSIICKITGKAPTRLDNDLEYKLVTMFREIQRPFEQHCPPERKNFLSYSYTLHKMCLILGKKELASHFPLLKSRSKNYAQDCIWKKICEDINWIYHPSV